MTSTSIYTPIKPTYLYIKQHSVTGLKYFGKTTSPDPYKYQGSGTYWKSHIQKYKTKFIDTLWVSDLYYDTSISEIALHFSYENNIVKSNEWANLILENGLDGGGIGMKGKIRTEEHKAKQSASRKGKTQSEETKLKISIANTGKTQSEQTKAKKSSSMKGKNAGKPSWNKGKPYPQLRITCPYCDKTGGASNMKRYHFDNCRINI